MDTLDLTWLIPAFPLAGSVLLMLFGRKWGEPVAGWVATAMCGAAFIATVVVFFGLVAVDGHDRHHVVSLFEWIPVGGFQVDVAFLADPLSVTMALFVTGIGSLIHLYSIGYMHGDGDYPKFFTYLNLFAASMLVLVLADNFLLSFLGWEGVGACSYFLISFWFTRDTAAVAGKKAFVTNRVGDFGFMVAMFLLFGTVGALDYNTVLGDGLERLTATTATAVALLFFLGATGKSAQLPLYFWLPDAMEGPTPVSALIHAATMVTAGVYLLCRIAPILEHGDPAAMTIIATIGAVTALFAATVACAQDDIKKVLAYSTVSQLGYMVLAVGTGGFVAAIFHMVTHAFFKALLFLGAGSVIHGLHDEQDMKRMGGLARWMPITWSTFLIGWLAIAGVPPLAGFWSKDEILAGAWLDNKLLWAIGVLTALLTAYYMSRQVFLVFYGGERWREPEHGREPHESPWTMTTPLVVLAGLAAIGGILNLPFSSSVMFLEHWLEPSFGEALHPHHFDGAEQWVLAVVAAAAAGGGILAAYLTWFRRAPDELAALEPIPLKRAWYVDAGVSGFMGGPGRWAADRLAQSVDKGVVDGAVNGLATLVRSGGTQLRRVQTGYVRNYALGVAAGVVAVLAYTLARTGL